MSYTSTRRCFGTTPPGPTWNPYQGKSCQAHTYIPVPSESISCRVPLYIGLNKDYNPLNSIIAFKSKERGGEKWRKRKRGREEERKRERERDKEINTESKKNKETKNRAACMTW